MLLYELLIRFFSLVVGVMIEPNIGVVIVCTLFKVLLLFVVFILLAVLSLILVRG